MSVASSTRRRELHLLDVSRIVCADRSARRRSRLDAHRILSIGCERLATDRFELYTIRASNCWRVRDVKPMYQTHRWRLTLTRYIFCSLPWRWQWVWTIAACTQTYRPKRPASSEASQPISAVLRSSDYRRSEGCSGYECTPRARNNRSGLNWGA